MFKSAFDVLMLKKKKPPKEFTDSDTSDIVILEEKNESSVKKNLNTNDAFKQSPSDNLIENKRKSKASANSMISTNEYPVKHVFENFVFADFHMSHTTQFTGKHI